VGLAYHAGAATLTVTNFGDSGAPGQLRTLINNAVAGDTIVIPPGTITLPLSLDEDANATGDIDIRKDLTIQGVGADRSAIVISGGERVFDVFAPATVAISNMTIRGGFGNNFGGGGGIRNAGTLTLTDVTVSGNTAPSGGGIANTGTMTLTDVTVSGNTAPSGGGIVNGGHEQIIIGGAIVVTPIGGTLSMTGGIVSNNTGGGIFNVAGTATLTDVTISGNTAMSGIRNVDTMTLTNVTVSGNTSSGPLGFGGGILNIGTLTLTNVTVSGNIADQFGGGIANLVVETGIQSGGGVVTQVSASTLTMTNVTVTGNTPGGLLGAGCSGLNCEQGSIHLTNTIMANNLLSANCSAAPVTITSLGHNLDSGTSCGFTGPGDLSNTDPLLGSLANNGGPTQTHALLPGSPAIDTGINSGCPSTDQRGVTRPQGAACDIGAYEFVPIPAIPTLSVGGLLGLAGLLAGLMGLAMRRCGVLRV
jgi:predicted outer membrane repeat protein